MCVCNVTAMYYGYCMLPDGTYCLAPPPPGIDASPYYTSLPIGMMPAPPASGPPPPPGTTPFMDPLATIPSTPAAGPVTVSAPASAPLSHSAPTIPPTSRCAPYCLCFLQNLTYFKSPIFGFIFLIIHQFSTSSIHRCTHGAGGCRPCRSHHPSSSRHPACHWQTSGVCGQKRGEIREQCACQEWPAVSNYAPDHYSHPLDTKVSPLPLDYCNM